jgi:diacylglycerol kinase family enzyme
MVDEDRLKPLLWLSATFSYLLSAFNKKNTWKKYDIIIDDIDYSGYYCLIHIANSPYFSGRATGAKRATPNDGLLDIVLMKSSGAFTALLSIRKYFHGKIPKQCVDVQAKKISIRADKPMLIQLDNEYIYDTNINLSLIPNGINFVAVNDLSYPLASIMAE